MSDSIPSSATTGLTHTPDKGAPKRQTWSLGDVTMVRVPKNIENLVEDHACIVTGVVAADAAKAKTEILMPAMEAARETVYKYGQQAIENFKSENERIEFIERQLRLPEDSTPFDSNGVNPLGNNPDSAVSNSSLQGFSSMCNGTSSKPDVSSSESLPPVFSCIYAGYKKNGYLFSESTLFPLALPSVFDTTSPPQGVSSVFNGTLSEPAPFSRGLSLAFDSQSMQQPDNVSTLFNCPTISTEKDRDAPVKCISEQVGTTFVAMHVGEAHVTTVSGGDSMALALGYNPEAAAGERWSVTIVSGQDIVSEDGSVLYHTANDLSHILSPSRLHPGIDSDRRVSGDTKEALFETSVANDVYSSVTKADLAKQLNTSCDNVYIGVFSDGFAKVNSAYGMCNAMEATLNNADITPDAGTLLLGDLLGALQSEKNPFAKTRDGIFYDDVTIAIAPLTKSNIFMSVCDGIGAGGRKSGEVAHAVTKAFEAHALLCVHEHTNNKPPVSAVQRLAEERAALPTRAFTF